MIIPREIEKHIKDMTEKVIDIGCTNAQVIKYSSAIKTLYLKIDKPNEEFTREVLIYKFLKGKLNVPKVIEHCNYNGYEYLLITEAKGLMAADKIILNDPIRLVKLLAKGIKELQSVPINDCPYDSSLDYKLRVAKDNIDKGLVELEESEDSYGFKTAKEIYDYLVNNKPEERLSFVHGDYCLPNIIIDKDENISFIDLGRAGFGDVWQDIALCVRSIKHNFKSDKYTSLFYEYLGIDLDFEKIKYYILLDELF